MSFDWETVPTPDSYLKYHPDHVQLDKTMKAWYVQRTGKRVCGAVTSPVRGIDRVDAESIMLGLAPSKSYESTAITRHGNFLQWGYGASPAEMTETGKQLFINCIVYIAGFDGQTPLVYDQSMTHDRFLRNLKYVTSQPDRWRRYFPADVIKRFEGDPQGLTDLYLEGIDFLYQDGLLYRIDADLQSLGFETNTVIENLDRFVEMMADPQQRALGATLMKRYTGMDFDRRQAAAADWLTKNRDYLYFFDEGGYRFIVLPVRPETLLPSAGPKEGTVN